MGPLIVIVVIVLILLANAINILQEYERGVIFRLGRFVGIRGPGFVLIIPFIEKLVRVGLRVVTYDVPTQDVITRDNVSVQVNAVVYFRVMDAGKAIIEIEDFLFATSQIAQTTLRSVVGGAELDELLSEREKLNKELQSIIDKETDPWGIKVTMVEIKHVDLPSDMQRAMARQAEAERDRRAKVIHAMGEYQASKNLLAAAQLMEKSPVTIQLRYLQTLSEISAEQNSTILFPIPIDLFKPFIKAFTEGTTAKKPAEKKKKK
ncbi:slipin family protein [candidate division WOR-3 bacterium]|nr:slipin family protein [candidate division WOR-3 bacterium]MCK4527055.1 slipin family protein [candidate division WOR-3 bacterium]